MDSIERLECVYYPGPVPSNGAVLMALCLVFDNIYFPGVYLPKGDYDKEKLHIEISRIESLDQKDYETQKLIGVLKFIEYRTCLDGILEYPSSPDSIFGQGGDDDTSKLVQTIYGVHFPPRENFEPIFSPSHLKGLPESNEDVVYAGDFYYQAGAILYAARKQLPLLDDGSGLALPFRARYKDNAQALAGLLAVESAGLALPDLPALTMQELVDFRMENAAELKNFRASMLRYAKDLNEQISEGGSAEEVSRKAKFMIETEINPSLHDLNRDLLNPNRPWYRRWADGFRITSSVVAGFVTGGLVGKTAAEGLKDVVLSELESGGAKQEAAKRSGLYYLLKAQSLAR